MKKAALVIGIALAVITYYVFFVYQPPIYD